MTDLMQRETGWLITKEHGRSGYLSDSRVGWGQLRVHADETGTSFDRPFGRTVFMDRSLTEHMIPEGERVRWISQSDDGDTTYEGIVKIAWLFDEDDLAFNIDRFCATDAGDTMVWYSVDDMLACARQAKNPSWVMFANKQSGKKRFMTHPGIWVQIYC